MSGNGCTGACCAAFYIKRTISELRDDARSTHRRFYESPQLADMLIPLTPKEANERAAQFGGVGGFKWADRGHHFTCRHWDEDTKLCTIYEDRPDMCRGFPYGDGCQYGEDCACVGAPFDDLLANAQIIRDAVEA